MDAFLTTGAVDEVTAKRFPHKRGFETDGILVELFLVRTQDAVPFTDFWGVTRYEWPSNVFNIQAGGFRVASAMSMLGYQTAWDTLQPTVHGKRVSPDEWLAHQNT